MYKTGDSMIEVRELLIKAFASAWPVRQAELQGNRKSVV